MRNVDNVKKSTIGGNEDDEQIQSVRSPNIYIYVCERTAMKSGRVQRVDCPALSSIQKANDDYSEVKEWL
jgi:hypothetical protein